MFLKCSENEIEFRGVKQRYSFVLLILSILYFVVEEDCIFRGCSVRNIVCVWYMSCQLLENETLL